MNKTFRNCFTNYHLILKIGITLEHLIEKNSGRILLISWWTFALVVNSLYTSVLVSLLLIVNVKPKIESVDELASMPSYSLCIQAGGYQLEFFKVFFSTKYFFSNKLIYRK